MASSTPYDWKLSFRESVMLEMKNKKEMAKGNHNEKNGQSPNLNALETY
jgi:hypothetical protein